MNWLDFIDTLAAAALCLSDVSHRLVTTPMFELVLLLNILLSGSESCVNPSRLMPLRFSETYAGSSGCYVVGLGGISLADFSRPNTWTNDHQFQGFGSLQQWGRHPQAS